MQVTATRSTSGDAHAYSSASASSMPVSTSSSRGTRSVIAGILPIDGTGEAHEDHWPIRGRVAIATPISLMQAGRESLCPRGFGSGDLVRRGAATNLERETERYER